MVVRVGRVVTMVDTCGLFISSGSPTNDNALSTRKYIVEQRVCLCNVDALQGLLQTELEVGVRFSVTLNMWNSLPTNKDKLFKLAGPDEEFLRVS